MKMNMPPSSEPYWLCMYLYFSLGVTMQYADEVFEEYNSDEEMDQPRLTE